MIKKVKWIDESGKVVPSPHVTISRKKYDCLKRLEENVKKNIKRLDEVLARLEACYSLHNLDDNDDYNEISNQKKLLESLDK